MRFPTISKASDQPAHMHSLIRALASRLNILSVKLLTAHRLEFVSLKGGCTGSSESTLVKMPHCVVAQFMIYWLRDDARYIHISKKRNKSDKYHESSFSCMQCAVSCSSSLKLCCFFSCKLMKRRHSYAIMFCVISPLSCAEATACYPSLKTTTTRGLIVGFFDLWTITLSFCLRLIYYKQCWTQPPPPPPPPRGCDKLIFSGQFGPRSGPTKCLMFCSKNEGADKTACAVCRLIFACNKVGVHTSTDLVNKTISEMSGAGDFPRMRRLVWASLLAHEIKYPVCK